MLQHAESASQVILACRTGMWSEWLMRYTGLSISL
jgi:hypothetical protein